MRRQELIDAIAAFKPELAQRLDFRHRTYTRVIDVVGEVCMYLVANQITHPEEPLAVIRRATMLIQQQGREFALEEEDEIQEQIDACTTKKQKRRAAYIKSITTPIIDDMAKAKIMKGKMRKLGESTMQMMGYVAPFPHQPRMWGAIWHSTPNTERIIVSMINLGIVEVVEYNQYPLHTVIQRGPRWAEYNRDIPESDNWKRSGAMLSEYKRSLAPETLK
jgi:hypothetical protein